MGDNEASCGRRTRRGLYSRISTFFTTELFENGDATRLGFRKWQTQDVLMFLDAKFGQNVPPVRKDVLPGAHTHTLSELLRCFSSFALLFTTCRKSSFVSHSLTWNMTWDVTTTSWAYTIGLQHRWWQKCAAQVVRVQNLSHPRM